MNLLTFAEAHPILVTVWMFFFAVGGLGFAAAVSEYLDRTRGEGR